MHVTAVSRRDRRRLFGPRACRFQSPWAWARSGLGLSRLDGGPELGLAGPPVGRAPGHLVIARPQGHGSALRDRECELGFRLLAEFFGHCVDWHAVTVDRTRALVTRL
jgi:hypothetical protein